MLPCYSLTVKNKILDTSRLLLMIYRRELLISWRDVLSKVIRVPQIIKKTTNFIFHTNYDVIYTFVFKLPTMLN
jgi:hypothetical protein